MRDMSLRPHVTRVVLDSIIRHSSSDEGDGDNQSVVPCSCLLPMANGNTNHPPIGGQFAI